MTPARLDFMRAANTLMTQHRFKGDSRLLRRVITRAVQVGFFNARLERGETLTLTFDT